jgi:transcriptional regulator with XRE-family HTH domain
MRRQLGDIPESFRATLMGMTEVNDAFRARRLAMGLSQDEFAKRLQAAGARTANKRLVQRYEYGEIRSPYPRQVRALEEVTGLPVAALGFEPAAVGAKVVDDGRGGHDLHHPVPELAADALQANGTAGSYAGVWLSRYEYFSSGRGASFVGLHYVVVLQSGNRLTVRSLAGSAASSLTMDITVDGTVLTGTWVEQTDRGGLLPRGAISRRHSDARRADRPATPREVARFRQANGRSTAVRGS